VLAQEEALTAAPARPSLHRHDLLAMAVLAALPVLMFVVPALAGHPVVPGDDLTQNYPLRVLAGWQLGHGHLPVFDPYIWSGAPLLAGWNAGAAYPLTALFAVLPGSAAWTLNLVVTWWTAGLGTFAFLRASWLRTGASFLGALTFAFAGAMTAQIPHFGLVAGLSWVPVALLAALRMSRSVGRARLGWAIALAAAVGLIFLAGEPRAIDDGLIIVVCYLLWRAWRLGWRREALPYLAVAAGAVLLGVALGAVQWLPGIEAVQTSQRGAHSVALFNSGSLPRPWLLLFLVPDLLGGSGSFGQPAFSASYNLTEVSGYVGLLPLVAACALLGQVRRRKGVPEWMLWHGVAALGVVLALGGSTVLGHLLARLPLYGGQRLQSRNLVIADFALAVLFAYWADGFIGAPGERRVGRPTAARRLTGVRGARRVAGALRLAGIGRARLPAAPGVGGAGRAGMVAGAVPPIAVIGLVAVAFGWGGALARWLGASPAAAGALAPWLVPFAAFALASLALLVWGPRLGPRGRMRALTWLAVADIVTFTLLAVVLVAPGPGHPAGPLAAASGGRSGAASGGPLAGLLPAAAFAHGGRFAIYDPGLLDSSELATLGAPDSNLITRTPSIEGYGSIVNSQYASATGSHLATGQGQNVLSLRAIGNGTLDQLDTTVLLTPAAYLITPATAGGTFAGPARAGPGTAPGVRSVAPHRSATWYLGSELRVSSVSVPVAHGAMAADALGGVRIGLTCANGVVTWLGAVPGPGSSLIARFSGPVAGVSLRVSAGGRPLRLGAPTLTTASGVRYRLDGALQGALVPPRWRFRAFDGGFAVFSDSLAGRGLRLPASAVGASVRPLSGPAYAPGSAEVSSPHGVTVIRSADDIPGWTATWHPAGSAGSVLLAIHRLGLVQAVRVPAGRGVVVWQYSPPGGAVGLAVSLGAFAVMVITCAFVALRRRPRRDPADPAAEPGTHAGLIAANG
jgi:hypothetical protein